MDDENEDLTSIELTGGHHQDVDGMEIDDGNQPTSTSTASSAVHANNAQANASDVDTGVPAQHARPTPGQATVNNNGHMEQLAAAAPEGDESPSDSDGEEDDDSSDSDSDDSNSEDEDGDEENEDEATSNQALPNGIANDIPNAHGADLPGNAAEGFFQGDGLGGGTDAGDGESVASDTEMDNASDSETEAGMNWCDPCRKTIYPRYFNLRLKNHRRKRELINRKGRVRGLKREARQQRRQIRDLREMLSKAKHGIRRTNIVRI